MSPPAARPAGPRPIRAVRLKFANRAEKAAPSHELCDPKAFDLRAPPASARGAGFQPCRMGIVREAASAAVWTARLERGPGHTRAPL